MNNPTNYAANILTWKDPCIDFLKIKNINTTSADSLYRQVSSSIKFRLPDDGEVLGLKLNDASKTICELQRLPYNCVLLEYRISRIPVINNLGTVTHTAIKQPAALVLVQDESTLKISGTLFYPIPDMWIPSQYSFVFDVHSGSLEATLTYAIDTDSSHDLLRKGANLYSHEIIVIAELMAALSCKNVFTTDVMAPKSINKARSKKGKQPFYSYKILTIDTVTGRTCGVQTGTHASPRVHLRRGHIRRLPKGNIWVNAAVVGDKSKGIVNKDYKLVNSIH